MSQKSNDKLIDKFVQYTDNCIPLHSNSSIYGYPKFYHLNNQLNKDFFANHNDYYHDTDDIILTCKKSEMEYVCMFDNKSPFIIKPVVHLITQNDNNILETCIQDNCEFGFLTKSNFPSPKSMTQYRDNVIINLAKYFTTEHQNLLNKDVEKIFYKLILNKQINRYNSELTDYHCEFSYFVKFNI